MGGSVMRTQWGSMARRGRVRLVRVRGWVNAGLRTKDEANNGKKARWRVAKSRMATYLLWFLGLKGDDDKHNCEKSMKTRKGSGGYAYLVGCRYIIYIPSDAEIMRCLLHGSAIAYRSVFSAELLISAVLCYRECPGTRVDFELIGSLALYHGSFAWRRVRDLKFDLTARSLRRVQET